MNSSFILNLFGTGIRYWVCAIPLAQFDEMNSIKKKNQVEWEHLLFDFDFLAHFGFNHWSDLALSPEQSGFLIERENRIEIKQGAKFLARFNANELTNYETLFPLYQTNYSIFRSSPKTDLQKFVLIHFEKGLIAKYRFYTNVFSMEDLTFNIHHINHIAFLSGIDLIKTPLKINHSDSVVTGCSVTLL